MFAWVSALRPRLCTRGLKKLKESNWLNRTLESREFNWLESAVGFSVPYTQPRSQMSNYLYQWLILKPTMFAISSVAFSFLYAWAFIFRPALAETNCPARTNWQWKSFLNERAFPSFLTFGTNCQPTHSWLSLVCRDHDTFTVSDLR